MNKKLYFFDLHIDKSVIVVYNKITFRINEFYHIKENTYEQKHSIVHCSFDYHLRYLFIILDGKNQ